MIEDDLCAIGFMFDAEHSREVRKIQFASNIELSLRTIGDKPGHVQSGQYLWPAATAAGNYLIESWGEIAAEEVIELGAGCGLAGIVASKLPGVRHVVWTDYDRGSLQLISENVDDNCSFGSYHTHFLEWGKPIGKDIQQENCYPDDGFKLVVGSDLIYCKEVIEPLFRTVAEVLHKDGVFVLVSSFSLEAVSLILLTEKLFCKNTILVFSLINIRIMCTGFRSDYRGDMWYVGPHSGSANKSRRGGRCQQS